MNVTSIKERDVWEAFRLKRPEIHGYSYSYRWIRFQADWMNGVPVTLGLWEDGRLLDVFAGVSKGRTIYAGPEMTPGGCIRPENVGHFLKHLPTPRVNLTTLYRTKPESDSHYELVIDLEQIETVEAYKMSKVSKDARQRYNKAKKKGVQIQNGCLDDFMDCYLDMCRRNRVRFPLENAYFRCMSDHLKDEMAIRSFLLDGRLMGSSMLIRTPGQIHAYFLLSKQEAFKLGLSAYLFFDLVSEALTQGKSVANCGPSAPWDGTFSFKQRLGARPVPLYTTQIQPGPLQSCLFQIKRKVKGHKSRKYLEIAEA